jgi:hypothetical protein
MRILPEDWSSKFLPARSLPPLILAPAAASIVQSGKIFRPEISNVIIWRNNVTKYGRRCRNADFVAGNQTLKSSMDVAPCSSADKRSLVDEGQSRTVTQSVLSNSILLLTSMATQVWQSACTLTRGKGATYEDYFNLHDDFHSFRKFNLSLCPEW